MIPSCIPDGDSVSRIISLKMPRKVSVLCACIRQTVSPGSKAAKKGSSNLSELRLMIDVSAASLFSMRRLGKNEHP